MKSLLAINVHKFHELDQVREVVQDALRIVEAHNKTHDTPIDTAIFVRRTDPAEIDALTKDYADRALVIPLKDSLNGEALNTQLDYANDQGFDIFFRADGDDFIFPERFALQLEQFIKDPELDVCGGALVYIYPGDKGSYVVRPGEHPGHWDFLSNFYCLHPTFAFRLRSVKELRYWHRRAEDKDFIYQARRKGLKFYNVQECVGSYQVTPQTRGRLVFNALSLWVNLKWSIRFNWLLLPLSLGLFVLRLLVGTQRLRDLRRMLNRSAKKDADSI